MLNEESERTDGPSGRVNRFRLLRLICGWGLLAAFVGLAAVEGRIENSVRFYQAGYIAGFVGYFLLIWEILRGPHRLTSCAVPSPILRSESKDGAPSLTSWRWWLIGCMLLRVIPLPAAPTDDAYRYLWEGRVQRAGFNPYLHAPTAPELQHLRDDDWTQINHPELAAIYGPVAEIEFLIASTIHPSVYTIKALHVVWDALIVVVLASILRLKGIEPHRAMIYGLCPLVLSAFAVRGHMDSLMLLLLLVAVRLTLSRPVAGRPIALAVGAMAGLAAASKIVAIVVLPWFLWRNRKAAPALFGVVILCYVPYLSAGTELFGSLFRFTSATTFFSVLYTLGITESVIAAHRTSVATVLLIALTVVLGYLAIRRKDLLDYCAGAFAAVILLAPVVHYWYLTWVLVFAPTRLQEKTRAGKLPVAPSWCWLTASLAMVCYFEAEVARTATGQWTMPTWAPKLVWGVFAATVIAESFIRLSARQIGGGLL